MPTSYCFFTNLDYRYQHSMLAIFTKAVPLFDSNRMVFWAFFLGATVALTGCGTTRSISDVGFPLDDSVVYITAVQNELETATSSTNPGAAGGGLLGVLIAHSIDSTRNRRAEDAVGELRDAMIDFSIADEFLQRLLDSELPASLSRLEPVALREDPGAEFAHHQHFIELHPSARLSNNLAALEVVIWLREFELNNRNRPRFAGFAQSYKFVHPLPEPGTGNSRLDYAEAWLELGADAIETLIRQGMDTTIDAALVHLQDESLASRTSARYRVPDYSNRMAYELRRETDDWIWLSTVPAPREIIIVNRGAAVQFR